MTTNDHDNKLPERVRTGQPYAVFKLLRAGVAPDGRTNLARTMDAYSDLIREHFGADGELNAGQELLLAGVLPLVGLVFSYLTSDKATMPPERFEWAWGKAFDRALVRFQSLRTEKPGGKAPSLDEVLEGMKTAGSNEPSSD